MLSHYVSTNMIIKNEKPLNLYFKCYLLSLIRIRNLIDENSILMVKVNIISVLF